MEQMNLRVAGKEKSHLEDYCRLTERTQSDVLREYIRSLHVEGVLNPLNVPGSHPDTPLRESAGLPAD
jgi:hypothetical protein